MSASQVDPGLDSELRHRVGQQVPQALRADQFLAHRRDVVAAQGRVGLHGADQRCCVAFLDPGPVQHGACPARNPARLQSARRRRY